ncbi:RNA polymerase sigma factor [Actinocatenispora thailandica]|uniref:RNA polymerase sigma factor n=1 Tax=Actinocatenispora thailandica TaxID=227318 RepID=A0A7R7HX06_9ACTN|nr:sigma-70 family RNA polymerase sigma factor [Actinocatenispora thailandica]BCJ35448.1 RNA polymerase sigma factor [Actinocatenispora thailandica]
MPASADDELLRSLYDEHAGPLYGYVLSLTGDRGWAQDIVQEVLLRAWQHPPAADGRPVRGWLYTVARHLVIDQWRARKVRPEVSFAEPPERGVADGTDEAMQSWLVAEALQRLSPAHREVLVECYYQGRSVPDAAQRIGVPAGTVKSRLHYALRALRLALQEMGVV